MKRLLLIPLLIACNERSTGLAPTPTGTGPKVVWDIEARPLPEIPLPNDQAARLDPSTATGRRLNVSEHAPTEYERRTRRAFNTLDGFGTYAPIMVSFEGPIDVDDLYARHNPDDDFRNDAVFLLNVDPDCARFGEEVALDVGRGRFPVTLYHHDQRIPDPEAPEGYRLDDGNALFDFDPLGQLNNMLFPEPENLRDPSACQALEAGSVAYDRCIADTLMTFYERSSDTLILRPIWPLEERCTYAVVLSSRLRGEDGSPVRSPFIGVNPREQTEALAPLESLLPRYDLGLEDVAFAWSFTTGTQTEDLLALRAGLYGHGVFAELADAFPVESLKWWTQAELGEVEDDRSLLDQSCAGHAMAAFWSLRGEWAPNLCALEADFTATAGVAGGTFAAPDLLVDDDGIATEAYPADDDELWRVDPVRGEVTYGPTEVTFWCALPHERAQCPEGNPEGLPFCKPFPVVLYGHGYGGSRGEILNHIGRHNAMGAAICALDGPGHGLSRLLQDISEEIAFTLGAPLFARLGLQGLDQLILRGRDRDLNNDGLKDSGADMWTSDVFHTRDMVRQSALETLQFVRILRSMDGREAGGRVLGDIDGDGSVDLGGPLNTVAMWGISLGGIVSGVVAGAEPTLNGASPNAGGAGLTDIATRSTQAGVPQAVVLPIIGPLVAGCLPTDDHQNPLPLETQVEDDCLDTGEEDVDGGTLRLAFLVNRLARIEKLEFGRIEGVRPRDVLRLENLDNGETAEATVDARGRVRLAVPADALGPIARRPLLGLGDEDTEPVEFADTAKLGDRLVLTVVGRGVLREIQQPFTFWGTTYPTGAPLVAPQEGLGLKRNTKDFRRFLGIAQHALGPADPGVWAARYTLEPAEAAYDPNWRPGLQHTLVMPTAGDSNVPVNTGIANARAAGALGSWLREPDKYGPEHGWRQLFAPDPRLGKSPDQHLIDTYAVEGDPRLQRHADSNPINPNVIYDVDDVSDGAAEWSCGDSDWSAQIGENRCPEEHEGSEVFFPAARGEHPLRLNWPRADGSHDAFRLPVLRPAGQHGIYNAQSFRTFDADAYMVNFTIRFLLSRGRAVSHEAGCDCSAARLPNFTLNGEPRYPAHNNRACTDADLKLCSTECAEAWGLWAPDEAACVTP